MIRRYDFKDDKFEIESKRFYLPLVLRVDCTNCGEPVESDMKYVDYLSHPTVNEKESVTLYCDECGEYMNMDVILRVSLDVDYGSLEKEKE